MSGSFDAKIALETRLKAIASPLATQWENTSFVPVSGVPYQRVNILFAGPDAPEMGGGFYQDIGYMQVALCYPINAGSGPALAYAQTIRDWFQKGLCLSANGLSVFVSKPAAIDPGFIDGDRYIIPVKISFFANNNS